MPNILQLSEIKFKLYIWKQLKKEHFKVNNNVLVAKKLTHRKEKNHV